MKRLRFLFRQNHLLLWGPVAVYYGLISFFSSLSSSEIHFDLGRLDKGVHFLEFGLLGALMARALFWERLFYHIAKKWWVIGGGVIAILAVVDEMHQMTVPGRSSDKFDWAADILGAAFGMIVCRAIYRRRKLGVLP